MGMSQTEFATKFGFSPATLRNWEQGRVRPDAPTHVLLAVIAKHPESVEDGDQEAIRLSRLRETQVDAARARVRPAAGHHLRPRIKLNAFGSVHIQIAE